jgi:thymidylate kinase
MFTKRGVMMTGKLIVFDGVDNTGKSYLAYKLYEYIKKNITDNVIYVEYSDLCYHYNPVIVDMLRPGSDVPYSKLQDTWLDSQIKANDYINDYINNDYIVISSRYYYSHYVYGDDELYDWLNGPHKDFIKPNTLFYIKADLDKIMDKNYENNDGTVYESDDKKKIINRIKRYQELFKCLSIQNNYEIFNTYDKSIIDVIITLLNW